MYLFRSIDNISPCILHSAIGGVFRNLKEGKGLFGSEATQGFARTVLTTVEQQVQEVSYRACVDTYRCENKRACHVMSRYRTTRRVDVFSQFFVFLLLTTQSGDSGYFLASQHINLSFAALRCNYDTYKRVWLPYPCESNHASLVHRFSREIQSTSRGLACLPGRSQGIIGGCACLYFNTRKLIAKVSV